jgi:hypothetical protein
MTYFLTFSTTAISIHLLFKYDNLIDADYPFPENKRRFDGDNSAIIAAGACALLLHLRGLFQRCWKQHDE